MARAEFSFHSNLIGSLLEEHGIWLTLETVWRKLSGGGTRVAMLAGRLWQWSSVRSVVNTVQSVRQQWK